MNKEYDKNNRLNIGIDIGGTKINVGIVDTYGTVIDSIKICSRKEKSCKKTVQDICKTINVLLERNGLLLEDIFFIGAGVPGTVSAEEGVVLCPNLLWTDEPVGKYFEQIMGRKVIVCQDTRSAALAEFLFGAAKNKKNVLCVSVGTGIGSGIILDGKLYHGAMNTSGEIGHNIFSKNGRTCECGRKGCLERYASGSGILESALEKMPEIFENHPRTAETVFDFAKKGDKKAIDLIDECVDDLAIGIASAINVLSVPVLVVSGGLCENDELFLQPLFEKIYDYGYVGWAKEKKLECFKAYFKNDASMIGAANLYQGL